VSRNVIREALSRFRMVGLIASNKKNGIRLIKFDLFPVLGRVLDPAILEKSTIHELIELRIMLEIGMADALFRNVSSENIQELRKIIFKYESSKKLKNEIEYEISFHSYLYKISRNQTLCGFQKYLKIVFDHALDIQTETSKSYVFPRKVTHIQLVECLEDGTVEEFRQLMHDHFSIYFEFDFFKETAD